MTDSQPKTPRDDKVSVAKPSAFDLDAFKSKRPATVAGVETLQGVLPHYKMVEAGDFVRLHPDEENYWSDEMCFVSVPIIGTKRDALHLIDEELGLRFLGDGKLKRFRLVLAAKPHNVFFLCHLPSQNLDNSWNMSVLAAAEQAKHRWVELISRRKEGVESYSLNFAQDPDAFPETKWLQQALAELIFGTFTGQMITDEKNPALLRLIGAKQNLS
jgi:hypothetical protein